MDLKDKIEQLITIGTEIQKTEFQESDSSSGMLIPEHISGPNYDKWMNDIKLLSTRYLSDYPLYPEIMDCFNHRHNTWGTKAFKQMMHILDSMLNDEELFKPQMLPSETASTSAPEKIFISHSSLDREYIEPFIDLLNQIGFAGRGLIFCSSFSGYDIPIGHNIYDYLKEQFNQRLFLVSILSDNYYSSAASLNEMGAAWITSTSQMAILLPEFEFSQIKGAIDPLKIWFKIDEKNRLNDFKDQLSREFNLPEINPSDWERIRDAFIHKISQIVDKNKFKQSKQTVEFETAIDDSSGNIICVLRFINLSLATVICSKLILVLFDRNQTQTSLTLNYNDLKQFKIFGKEQKRIVINIAKDRFENSSSFDFNTCGKWITDSNWSTHVE